MTRHTAPVPPGAKDALQLPAPHPTFSIGTLLTDCGQYDRMLRSFERNGFDAEHAEFLYIDNRQQNSLDAYQGLTLLLARSAGEFVILCHQDVELLEDGREQLEARLAELCKLDPHWAVAGNAGWGRRGPARRISDPHGANQRVGTLPAPAESLDENLLIVRREAMLGFSRDLAGFHLYGTDICQQAKFRGWSSWVIDFHLAHHSRGRMSRAFYDCLSHFERKYSRLRGSYLIRTTCKQALLGGTPLRQLIRRLRRSPSMYRMTRRIPFVRRIYTAALAE